jgi:CubicO group peptidase (beta-lactamase class C family)
MERLRRLSHHLKSAPTIVPAAGAAAVAAVSASEVVRWSRGLVQSGELPCAAVLVAQGGRVLVSDSFGPLRPPRPGEAAPPPIDESTLFRLYSMTKPIVAAAAMALVDEGKLALSDSLSTYLPGFGEQPQLWSGGAARSPPTVQHLLQHRAGIHCQDFGGLFSAAEAQLESFADPHRRLELTMDMLASEPLVHEPGTDFVYGLQFDILGRVLEVAGEQPLDALLKRLIFDPLGMRNTFFCLPAEAQLAAIYQPTGGGGGGGLVDVSEQNTRPGVRTVHPLGYLCGGEGLVSSMDDFYRFAAALLNGGALPSQLCSSGGVESTACRRFLSAESARTMTTNQLDGGSGTMADFPHASAAQRSLGFGMGVSVSLGPDEGGLGHAGEFGWGGAASTVYWADPEADDLLVLFFTSVLGARRGMKEPLRRIVYAERAVVSI